MYNYDYLKNPCHQNRLRIVSEFFHTYLPKAPHILSVGCGSGIIEKDFPGTVQGLDKEVPPDAYIPVAQGELEHIPFGDQQFDGVFLGEILEHVYDTHRALAEVARVLKKGGILVITVPNAMSLRDRVRGLFGVLPRHLGGYLPETPHLLEHIRHFNQRSLLRVLENNGFEVVEVTSPAINLNFFGSKSWDLYAFASVVPSLSNNLIFVARVK